MTGEFGGVQILSEAGSNVEGLGINGKSFSHSKVPPVLQEDLLFVRFRL